MNCPRPDIQRKICIIIKNLLAYIQCHLWKKKVLKNPVIATIKSASEKIIQNTFYSAHKDFSASGEI